MSPCSPACALRENRGAASDRFHCTVRRGCSPPDTCSSPASVPVWVHSFIDVGEWTRVCVYAHARSQVCLSGKRGWSRKRFVSPALFSWSNSHLAASPRPRGAGIHCAGEKKSGQETHQKGTPPILNIKLSIGLWKKKVVKHLMWLWKSFVGSQEITHIMSSGLLYLILESFFLFAQELCCKLCHKPAMWTQMQTQTRGNDAVGMFIRIPEMGVKR